MKVTLNQIAEITGIRLPVLEFALIMEEKLKKNDHKGGWENESFGYLLSRIPAELSEANIAFIKAESNNFSQDKEIKKAQRELADVANFCMMVSDNLDSRLQSEKYVKY